MYFFNDLSLKFFNSVNNNFINFFIIMFFLDNYIFHKKHSITFSNISNSYMKYIYILNKKVY